jgi:hypothetical protein
MSRQRRNSWLDGLVKLTAMLLTHGAALAHSASDAYLTLAVQDRAESEAAAQTIVHGQWDIALRDLDFVLKLDDNGDGKIVWGELRKHQAAVSDFAYANIHFTADGKACRIVPTRQAVDSHADGAYAALFFDVICDAAAKRLTLDYRLFFAVDPSHRGILVLRSGDKVATSVLSPANAKIELGL